MLYLSACSKGKMYSLIDDLKTEHVVLEKKAAIFFFAVVVCLARHEWHFNKDDVQSTYMASIAACIYVSLTKQNTVFSCLARQQSDVGHS